MLLPDTEIAKLALAGMIDPFIDGQVAEGAISYGLSSAGYDARLGSTFKVFRYARDAIIDPKAADRVEFDTIEDAVTCVIPAGGYALGTTIERFVMPDDVMALCLGKSTYARSGLIVNVTPLEPGWEGYVTIEMSNSTPSPIKVYANEGICQFIFMRTQYRPRVTYRDRKGKYQGQQGVTLAKV